MKRAADTLPRLVAMLPVFLAACGGQVGPAGLDTRNDTCRFCRMTVSDARFSAQLVSPGEEPRFFDDIGCLQQYLRQNGVQRGGTVAYVADHRTRAWVRADQAAYTRVARLETPMSSHLIAHADAASRDADKDSAGGVSVSATDIFGPGGPPGR